MLKSMLLPTLRKFRILLLIILSAIVSIAISLPQTNPVYGQDVVGDIARRITVRVEGGESGSGVLIGKRDNFYYALTAKHVVGNPDNYAVVTHDESAHRITDVDILRVREVDLAVLRFTSDQDYDVATVADSALVRETTSVWVSGFPMPGRENDSIFHITNGKISARPVRPHPNGYDLTYSNETRAGMSGGPVLNDQGHLVGIHGLAEAENTTGENGTTIGIPGWTNLGIPINIFKTVAPYIMKDVELALADPAESTLEAEVSNCVEQLKYREIATTDGPDENELWRYPSIIIGPSSDDASIFGPEHIPGSSMQAEGCHIKRSGFLGSRITWICPEPKLRVEAMSNAQAYSQCDSGVFTDLTPGATARREEVRWQQAEEDRRDASMERLQAETEDAMNDQQDRLNQMRQESRERRERSAEADRERREENEEFRRRAEEAFNDIFPW
ncbi:MAG: serine protease [Cyanobacteria bacterium P01_A01_bin.116]